MTEQQPDTRQRLTMLIVEDQPDITIILERLLAPTFSTYKIAVATSGGDALECAKRAKLALVLTDYNMPDMDGIELTMALRAMYPDLPIIMLTAYASPELEKQAREAGVTAFMSKPFFFDHLLALIGRYLPKEPV